MASTTPTTSASLTRRGRWRPSTARGPSYRAAIGALHANGIQALADVVLNQRLGADGCEDVLAQEVLGSDVDVNDPRVYEELVRWGRWYVDECSLDGFRLDALKHIDRGFYLRWLADMRAHAGRELFCVGEYWARTADELEAYLGGERCMSLFDVPLHYNLYRASCSNGGEDLSRIFSGALVERDPVHAVTFAENHDTQPGQALQSFVQTWFKPSAYALILLREAGYPCVFYGDLYGMPNDGNIPAVRELPLLMEIRRRFAYGAQHDFLDAPDVIGWTREGDDEHEGSGVAVVLTDRDGGEKRMFVGEGHAGERWACVVGEQDDVEVGADGWATFRTLGGRLSVYLPEKTADALENDRQLHRIAREIAEDTEEMRA